MLIWSKNFETKIEHVDLKHKLIFDLLNKLVKNIDQADINYENLDSALKLLIHHAKLDFHDEELLMMESRIDKRHLSRHVMEHKSFIYDVDRFSDITASYDRRITGKLEKLVRFITFWLTFHILGTDMVMAAQIANIKLGMNPQQAFDSMQDRKLDATTVNMMLDAVMNLWLDAKDRCMQLEKKSSELEEQIMSLQMELQLEPIDFDS